MRRHWAPALVAPLLLLSGCLSASSGYGLARDTVQQRVGMAVADDQASAASRKRLLSKPLTADSAARLALLNSPDVEIAMANIGIARAQTMAALRLPNPTAEFGAHFHDDGADIEVGATIGLLELLLAPARGAAGGELLDAAALEAAGSLLDVAFAAKIAFFEYQAALQIHELRKTVTYAMAQSSEIAARLLEAGNIPELEALTERALYEEARLALARAEVNETTARERVNEALGLFGTEGASWTTAAMLPAPDGFDAANLESGAIAASLELSALEKRYAAAATQSDVAWVNGVLPDIEVGVGADREADDNEWGIGPRVQVGIPLLYQGQAEIAGAEAQMRSAKGRTLSTATRIRSTARSVTAELSQTRASAQFYRKTLLPLRERIVDETLRQYNAMNLGPFQVLQAKRDEVEAGGAYVMVLRDYWVARTQAEMLLAGRLPPMGAAARNEPAAGGGQRAADH